MKLFSFLALLFFIACGPRSGTNSELNKVILPMEQTAVDAFQLESQKRIFENGKSIFQQHCFPCHWYPDVHAWDAYTFDEIFDRMPDPSEIYFTNYIKNSKALKDSGDTYAKAIDNSYPFSPFEHIYKDSLSELQIKELMLYIKVGVKLK